MYDWVKASGASHIPHHKLAIFHNTTAMLFECYVSEWMVPNCLRQDGTCPAARALCTMSLMAGWHQVVVHFTSLTAKTMTAVTINLSSTMMTRMWITKRGFKMNTNINHNSAVIHSWPRRNTLAKQWAKFLALWFKQANDK